MQARLADRAVLLTNDRGQRLHRRGPAKRMHTGRHLVQHHAERELIGSKIDGTACRLLGAHIRHRPDDETRRGLGRIRRSDSGLLLLGSRLCKPEVDNLDPPVAADHHVFGFNVAVHDAGAMRCGESAGDSRANVKQTFDRRTAAINFVAKRGAVDEFRDDVGCAVVVADVIDHQDVGMIQCPGGNGLLCEPALARRINDGRLRQNFDCDFSMEPRIAGPIHFAHAAGAEPAGDLVRPEPRSDQVAQRLVCYQTRVAQRGA